MLQRPQIERRGGHFIHHRLGQAVLGEIYCLEIPMASVAALHTDVIEITRRVHRQFCVVLLPAAGTNNASELPLRETKRAHQRTPRSVSLLAEHGQSRLAIAKRAKRM